MANQISSVTTVDFPSTTDIANDITKPILARVKKLKNSQNQLSQIQKDIDTLIDAMTKNPSLISRAASYWGQIPLWQKIIAGIVLASPTLVIGILTQLITCFVITGFLVASYVGSSLILDDHYNHTQHSTKNIKTGVTGLAEGLNLVTQTLEEICDELSTQVQLFSKENEKFGNNVETLALQNQALTKEVERLKAAERQLFLTQEDLRKTSVDLKKSVDDQTILLEQTQAALNKVKIDFERNQQELAEKNKELSEVKKHLELEVARYGQQVTLLQTALNDLAANIVKAPEEQEKFYKKIEDFIQDKNNNFLDIFDSFSKDVKELAQLKEQYKQRVDEYELLIYKQREQVNNTSRLLEEHGFYAPLSPTRGAASSNNEIPTLGLG